jgi:hypothetical protein
MFFCLRIDLDYVPWDTPDATEFGHGEPATLLRILDLGRTTGYRFQFFISNRALRAFPSTADAVLNDGHDLDWFCKHPEDAGQRYAESKLLFKSVGHIAEGMSVKNAWPANATFEGIEELKFLSAAPGPAPKGLRHFPVELRSAREAARSGINARSWSDAVKANLRDAASRNVGTTITVRPQVLAKFDPRLTYVREVLDLAQAVGLSVKSLREVLNPV